MQFTGVEIDKTGVNSNDNLVEVDLYGYGVEFVRMVVFDDFRFLSFYCFIDW
jgi:hypothetical protein